MKKPLFLFIIPFFTLQLQAEHLNLQDSTLLNLSRDGFNSVTIYVENKSKSDIHSKIIQWINSTYMSPEQVVLANNTDEIRLKSVAKDICSVKIAQKYIYHVLYTLRIPIKDSGFSCYFDIYQFDYSMLGEYQGKAAVYVKTLYKKSGEARKTYKNCSNQIPIYFEALLQSLIDTVNSSLTREEAIEKLKQNKDLLDLGLITEEDYNKLKSELTPLIIGK